MPQQRNGYDGSERRYDETVAPSNPPSAVVQPEARRTALRTYLGILVGFFLVVGGALLFWAGNRPGPAADDARIDADAVGTSGERMPRESTPGGFDPSPEPGSTAAELEFRGAGEPRQGPMPGLRGLKNQSSDAARGRTIELRDVEVERADGNTFWVRDGDDRASVVTAGGMPTVRAGQRVDVTGTLEAGGGDVRIRATRIQVK
jgi:hypothetical protein